MKTKFYILLILSLTFSLANAQSDNNVKETVSENVTSKSNDEVNVNTHTVEVSVSDKVEASNEPTIIEGSIARGYSDIRVYRNRMESNTKNIDYLFPKIYKLRTA